MTEDEKDITEGEISEPNLDVESGVNQPASARSRFNWEGFAALLLLLVLLIGAYFRFSGLNWDGNHHLHPDERFLTIVASSLQSVDNPLDYLRTSVSTLNPYNINQSFYVYGNFPMTVTRYLAEWADGACAFLESANFPVCPYRFTAYDGVHLLGRFLSGLVDLVSIFFTFLIGRRLYDWRVGILGSLLLALAVMPIQQSHFFTMDNWAAALTTMTLYATVRLSSQGDEQPSWRIRWYFLFGLGLGLGAASRINIAPLALMVVVGATIWLFRRHDINQPSFGDLRGLPSADIQRIIGGIALAAIISMITFRLAQPYAFSDAALVREGSLAMNGEEPGILEMAIRSVVGFNDQWLSNMEEIQRLQAPEASFPPALQWTDRAPILFPLNNMILYGMGITAGITAVLGFIWALWRMIRFRPDWMSHAILVIWSGGYFLFMGTRWVKSVRYFLPIYPTLLLLAAWMLIFLWDRAGRSTTAMRRVKQTAAGIIILLVVVPTFLWAMAYSEIYRQPVTRIAASDYIFENIPSGATLLYTADGELREHHLPLKEFVFKENGIPLSLEFTMPESGVISGVRFNYLTDENYLETGEDGGETLHLTLNNQPIGEITLDLNDQRQSVVIDLPQEELQEGTSHVLVVRSAAGGPVKAGTTILANEHWDDLLPVGTNGRNAYGMYYTEVAGGQRPVTHPDNPQKRQEVLTWLDEADYIMLSSQRALWHLPRLPLTYPLMMRYYESLFNGELGFELVHQEHATHQIGPLYISDTSGQISWGSAPEVGWPPPGDLAAEEAFSVYDHPPVWIFKKTDDYSSEKAAAILNEVDLTQVITMNPLEATQAPNGLYLTQEAQTLQQANGTFSETFNLDSPLSNNPFLAAVVWWLAVILLGWLAFPLTFVVLRGLPDRGYALARVLSLLFISYFTWAAASLNLLHHTQSTIILGALVLGFISLIIFIRRRKEMLGFIRKNLPLLLTIEFLGIVLYALQIGIRLGNPDVWDVIWGGEKPMDLSYFNAVLKSSTFPPYDPWFAGGYINYYYYGFVYVGALTKLLGVVPTLAYNLILPMLFSFTGLGVFSIAYNLVAYRQLKITAVSGERKLWRNMPKNALIAGLFAVVLAILVGNLAELGVLLGAWFEAGSASLENLPLVGSLARTMDGAIKIIGGQDPPIYPGDWFWRATRAINYLDGEVAPITEFPFFTFLYGDLHAHMISLPLQALALGWAVAMALQDPTAAESAAEDSHSAKPVTLWETGLQWLMGGLAIGVLWATNTWDFPTYLVIAILAVIFATYRQIGRFDIKFLGITLVRIIALAALSIIAFWPYNANYGQGYSSISLWPGSYTQLSNYLVIYGVFLFILITYLIIEFRSWTRTWSQEGLKKLEGFFRLLILTLVLFVAIIAILALRGYLIAPVALTLIVSAGLLGLRPGIDAARRIVLILIASALGLTLIVEIVVLDGDIGRMNTVFKFYMQAWIILSVTAGTAVVWSWEKISQKATMRTVWQIGLALLLATAALYPLLATRAKWQIRMSQDAPNTLDGMAFMPYTQYGDTNYAGESTTIFLGDDYEALRWMQRNIAGSPVIAEAHGSNPYRSIASRVTMYTGLPGIVGWDWHQRQQRAVLPGNLVSDRIDDVNMLYNTLDIDTTQNLLEKYNVQYLYAGQLERAYYRPEALAKFEEMVETGILEIVYRDPSTTIYRVKESNEA